GLASASGSSRLPSRRATSPGATTIARSTPPRACQCTRFGYRPTARAHSNDVAHAFSVPRPHSGRSFHPWPRSPRRVSTPHAKACTTSARSSVMKPFLITFFALPLHAADYDLLIRNARIVDGTGNPWFHADVAVKDGRITAIGRLPRATADRVIDARR